MDGSRLACPASRYGPTWLAAKAIPGGAELDGIHAPLISAAAEGDAADLVLDKKPNAPSRLIMERERPGRFADDRVLGTRCPHIDIRALENGDGLVGPHERRRSDVGVAARSPRRSGGSRRLRRSLVVVATTCEYCGLVVDPTGGAVLVGGKAPLWQPLVADLRSSPFKLAHAECFAENNGIDALSWQILGREGFAQLKIGDERSSVRERFGSYHVFRRTAQAPESDQFLPALGGALMVTYRSEEKVSFIELATPMNPTLKDVPLLGRSLADVAADLGATGVDMVEDPSGAFVPDWGVGLYVPMDEVEGVSIGE